MGPFLKYASGMACPTGGEVGNVVALLGRGRLRGIWRRIVDALVLPATSDALSIFTEGPENAWRPEVGLAQDALRRNDVALSALQVALALAGTGGHGTIEAAIAEPKWLYFDGWLVAAQGIVRVTAAREYVLVDTEASRTTFRAVAGRWIVGKGDSGPWFAYDGSKIAPRYVTASGMRHNAEGFPWIDGPPPRAAAQKLVAVEARIAPIRDGWRTIVEGAPEYAHWVASTVTGCLLLDRSGTHEAQSGSSYDHPGLIAIEPPECPVYCGELLVHESSHQHLLAYMMVEPLVTPGSLETAYSPIKRMERTIDRVLTGAHAVGNMILYYEHLSRYRALDTASLSRLAKHRDWFESDYTPAMEKSVSLTDAGTLFWRSLHTAVMASASKAIP